MKTGLSALAQGQHIRGRDILLFRALRDRLGFTRLRSAATGGAALGPDHLQFFQAMGVPLRTLYGQTECSAPTRCIRLARSIRHHGRGDGRKHRNPHTRARTSTASAKLSCATPHVPRYYKSLEASAADMKDGWMHSGDAGYFNDHRQLVVIDASRSCGTAPANGSRRNISRTS